MIFTKKELFSHIVCISLSVLLVYLLGYPQRFDRILLTYFSLIFLARFTFFRFLLGLLSVIAALYFPIGFYYGSPNVAVVSAVAETDIDEIQEFCSQLPLYFYFIPLLLVISFILFFKKFQFPKIGNYYIIAIALLICLYRPVKGVIKYQPTTLTRITTTVLDNFKYPFFEFCLDLYSSVKIYLTEKQEQLKQLQQTNTIPIVSVNPQHKTYIVIIGESVRKDYMSAYGFKYNNTPFTDNNASLIWDGLIAPASNTQSSIPHLSSYLDNREVKPN